MWVWVWVWVWVDEWRMNGRVCVGGGEVWGEEAEGRKQRIG